MTNALSIIPRCLCVVGIAAISTHTYAVDLNVQAGYTAEYTDNTALTANNETSEWIQTPELLVYAVQEGPSLSGSADYSISRQYHQRDTFNDQTNTQGTALLTWRAIADRLTFDAANESTLTTINSQAANVPTNQQVINTTTGGATLTVPGFSNHRVDLRYEYSIVNAHQTETDSKRQTGTVSYVIPLNVTDRIQLNGSVGDVNYDSSRSVDYVGRTADLQYVRGGKLDVIELETRIGYSEFDRKHLSDNPSATIGDATITWHATTITTFVASYTRSLQDQSTDLATGIPDFGQTLTDNTNVTTPYTLDAWSLGVTTQFGYNTVDLTGYIDDQTYENAPQTGQLVQPDQNTKGVTLGISRALRPTVQGRLFVNYSKADFKDSSNQDNYDTGLRLEWTGWRNLTVAAGTTYSKRTSDVASQEYDEWAGAISVFYSLIGQARR